MRVTHKARLLGQTAAIALLLPGLAVAQDAEIPLQPIVVDGETGTGPVGGVANPMTQAGSKTATPVTEVPQSVSVVSSDEIRAMNLTKLDEAFGYVSGVTGAAYGYDSDTNWIFIRGFDATQTGSYQDGLQNFGYGFGSFYIDPFLIERIDVLKGASSALYGGSNPGGLVNYSSKVPTGENTTEVEGGIAQHGGAWASIDQNRALSANTSTRLLGKIERVDGHGAFDAGYHALLSGSVRTVLDNGAELGFGVDLTKVDESHVGNAWLPYVGTVIEAPFGRIPQNFNVGEPDHDSYERDQIALRMTYSQDIGGWAFTNNTRLGWADIDEQSVVAYGYAGFSEVPTDAAGTLARGVFDHQTKSTTFLNDARVERTFNTGAFEHRVMAGLDLKYYKTDILESSGGADGLAVTDPVYGGPLTSFGAYKDVEITQRQAGVYVQDQIRWGDGWIGTANLRYDWTETEMTADTSANTPARDRDDSKLTGRVGLAKTFDGGLTAYASASTFFNPTTDPQAGNENAEPEKGQQYELGLKWAPSDDVLLTAAVFDLTRENVSQSTGFPAVYSQLGEVRSRGIELEAQGRITPELTLRGAYTKMDLEVREDQDASLIGNIPRTVPEEFASLKLAYTPAALSDWTFTGGVRYTGESWADAANTNRVPGRTVYDLGVTYRMQDDLQVNLAVSNLTDKDYVSSCAGSNYCYYGQERTASLAIRKSF